MSLYIEHIGSNQTEVERGHLTILVSYQTPVAVWDRKEKIYFRTSEKYSRTTSKHINRWIPEDAEVFTMPQGYFDNLMA